MGPGMTTLVVLVAYSGSMVVLGYILGRKTRRDVRAVAQAVPTVKRPEGLCLCGHQAIYHADKASLDDGCQAQFRRDWFSSLETCRCAVTREEVSEW